MDASGPAHRHWELSVGVYMAVKGFRTPPATDANANVVPASPAALTHA